jgi:hypothetical protein
MNKRNALLYSGITAICCLCLWKNYVSYGARGKRFVILKSLVDSVLIIVTGMYVPYLLVAWCVAWATRPIKNNTLRTTVSVLLGMTVGWTLARGLEILYFLSIFAIDLVTGRHGFLYNLERSKQIEEQAKLSA